ncbi:MAG: hypothetical protein KAI73_03295, partial [Rhodospirillaceae bacterium]|nr:hypothetical protein [Rhodospirillaceae bacterium]
MDNKAFHENLSPEQVLRWQLDAGVDEAVGEVAQSRFVVKPEARPSLPGGLPDATAAVSSQSISPTPAKAPPPKLTAKTLPGQEQALR